MWPPAPISSDLTHIDFYNWGYIAMSTGRYICGKGWFASLSVVYRQKLSAQCVRIAVIPPTGKASLSAFKFARFTSVRLFFHLSMGKGHLSRSSSFNLSFFRNLENFKFWLYRVSRND